MDPAARFYSSCCIKCNYNFLLHACFCGTFHFIWLLRLLTCDRYNISIKFFSSQLKKVQISLTLCRKHSTLCLSETSPDNDDDDDDDYDGGNDDDDSVDDDFNENDDSDNDDGGDDGGGDVGDNVGDDGGEDDADNDDGDENDNNMDITGDDEITEEHELPQQIYELSLEAQMEDFDESDLEKVNIHEYVY